MKRHKNMSKYKCKIRYSFVFQQAGAAKSQARKEKVTNLCDIDGQKMGKGDAYPPLFS